MFFYNLNSLIIILFDIENKNEKYQNFSVTYYIDIFTMYLLIIFNFDNLVNLHSRMYE